MSDLQTSAEVIRDTGVVDDDNPWPGLAAFREYDHRFFHGRDQAIETLTELVTRSRLSVLYGASGLGKTSLIQAGLFRRAHAHDLFPVRIRLALSPSSEPPAEQVFLALIRKAAEKGIEAPAREPAETLWEFFYRKDALWWNDRHHLMTPLLVFDQFEEIFTIGRRNTDTVLSVQQFLEDLRGIVLGSAPAAVKARCDADPDQALRYSLSRCPVRVLFSFREDYLAEFLELRDAFPAIGEQNCRLLRMSADEALSAIRKAGRHLVEDSVASRIVQLIAAAKSARSHAPNDLAVDPALLSVFCRELNNERRGKPQDTITDDLLQDKQERILEDFYARSFWGLDPRVQVFVENELLLPDSAERNSVAEQVALRRPGVTAEAIENLIDRRLLRRDERDGPPRLELTHDVLIEPARRSRDARLIREGEERRLAAARADEETIRKTEAEAQERERQKLLLEVERARAEHAASEVQNQRDRRLRVQRFLAIVTVLALFAAFQWYRANQEGARAKRALATAGLIQASSKYEGEGRNDIALAYLGYAAGLDPENSYTRGRLLDSLLHRTWPVPLAILKHDGPAVWAQFAADGARVLSASNDRVGVRLWPLDGKSAQPVRALGAPAMLAHTDSKGRYALVVTVNGNVEVWDGATGRTLQTIAPEKVKISDGSGGLDIFTVASFDGGATLIATATLGGVIRLWRTAATGHTLLWTNAEDTSAVRVLQLNDDGSRLLTWAESGKARVIDAATGGTLATFTDIYLFDGQFASNRAYLVTASSDGARLWKLPDAPRARERGGARMKAIPLEPIFTLKHEGAVKTARFSHDGSRVVTASEDGTASIWDVTTGGRLTPALRHRRGVLTAFFSADDSRVVTASKDKSARVWDAETGAPITEPLWHEETVQSATFSADGQRVVTASDDGIVEVWDVRPGKALPDMVASGSAVAQFNADGSAVLLSGSAAQLNGRGPTQIWSLKTGKVIDVTPPVSSARLSRDRARFLTLDRNVARTWTAETGSPLSPPMTHERAISTARFSQDAERVATVSADGSLRFWNSRSGSAIGMPSELLKGAGRRVSAAGLSIDVTLAAVGVDGPQPSATVAVWDVSRNPPALIKEISAPWPLADLQFDPANRWLLLISGTDTAVVWPLRSSSSGPPVKLVHDGVILSGRFSPDGDRILTTSQDSTARIWTFTAGSPGSTILPHGQSITWAEFSPDGQRVVTASRDGTVRLWETATGSEISIPLTHEGNEVIASQFSADGEKIVTTCLDGVARVWDVPVGRSDDASALASLANAVSGYEVRTDGTLARLDQIGRLQNQRSTIAAVRDEALPRQVGRWLLADRWTRDISPFSTTSVEAYLKARLTDSADAAANIVRQYAGHPALMGKAGGRQ